MGVLRAILSGLVLTFALAGCSKRPEATAPLRPPGPRHVVLQTDWFPQAEHGGFYQALAKGFYREAGLDVEIRSGGPGASIKIPVSKGEVDFGLNRADDVILFASRGLPLVMVMATFQHDPQALMVHESSPVKTLRDVEGRTITANVGMTWIPYLQKIYGIKFGLKPNSYSVAGFLADKETIQQCLVTNEPFFAQQHGARVRTLPLKDSGYDVYHTVICRRELTRTEPDVVRAFVAASIRGWRDYLTADPTPANELILARNKEMSPALLEFSRGEMILRKLVQGEEILGEDIGQLVPGRVGVLIDVLLKIKVLETHVAVSEVATREFLPRAAR